jgi:hypothetical protein
MLRSLRPAQILLDNNRLKLLVFDSQTIEIVQFSLIFTKTSQGGNWQMELK